MATGAIEVGALVLAELLKVGLTAWMTQARMAGMTQEQILEFYRAESARFYANDPAKIPG